eukprot:gene12885-12984_t
MSDIPTGELLWVRSVVAFSLVSLFIKRSEWAALFTRDMIPLHLLRMVCSAIEVVCFYWAISRTPLADMTAIYLASPIYVTAMAAIFLREPVGWRRWTAVTVGFLGVLVAVQPSGASISTPMLVAVGGSALYAASLVITRKLRATSSTILVATQMAALFILTSASSTLGWAIPTTRQLALMVAIGIVSMIAFWCVNEGLRLARASAVAPFNYTSIVWAMALGYLLFGDIPSISTMLGAAIIVCAGLFIMLRERKLAVAPTS